MTLAEQQIEKYRGKMTPIKTVRDRKSEKFGHLIVEIDCYFIDLDNETSGVLARIVSNSGKFLSRHGESVYAGDKIFFRCETYTVHKVIQTFSGPKENIYSFLSDDSEVVFGDFCDDETTLLK